MIRLLWLKKVSLKETSGKLVQLCREWSNESEACHEKKKAENSKIVEEVSSMMIE